MATRLRSWLDANLGLHQFVFGGEREWMMHYKLTSTDGGDGVELSFHMKGFVEGLCGTFC